MAHLLRNRNVNDRTLGGIGGRLAWESKGGGTQPATKQARSKSVACRFVKEAAMNVVETDSFPLGLS